MSDDEAMAAAMQATREAYGMYFKVGAGFLLLFFVLLDTILLTSFRHNANLESRL